MKKFKELLLLGMHTGSISIISASIPTFLFLLFFSVEKLNSNAGNTYELGNFLIYIFLFPIGEEIIFRFLLFMILKKFTKYYNLIQSLLFGAAHLNIVQGFKAGVSGIIYGNVRERKGLHVSIILHCMDNFIGLGYFIVLKILGNILSADKIFIVPLITGVFGFIIFVRSYRKLGKWIYRIKA